MAKMTYEEARNKLDAAKQSLKEKKAEFSDFLTENELKKGKDYSKDPNKTVAANYKNLKKAISSLTKERDSLVEKVKSLKPAGGKSNVKYVFPDDVKTKGDQKKYRTKVRGWAKKAGVTVEEFLANPGKYKTEEVATKKKKKKVKASEETAAPAKKKKKKKAKVAEEPTDED